MDTLDVSYGILPRGYEWAYGWWRITENKDAFAERVDLIIGSDYIQQLHYFDPEVDYPVYVRFKESYEVSPIDENRIDIGHYCLNKEDKTVLPKDIFSGVGKEGFSCIRIQELIDGNIIEDYNEKKATSPLNGEWRSSSGKKMTVNLLSDPFYIMHKDGTVSGEIEEFKYVGEGQMLYRDYNSGEGPEEYKKYNKKDIESNDEDTDELLRYQIAGKTFSCLLSEPDNPNASYLLEYKFSDDIYILSFYDYQPWGAKLLDRSTGRWTIVNGRLRTYDKSIPGDNKYDEYRIGYDCIIDVKGNIFN